MAETSPPDTGTSRTTRHRERRESLLTPFNVQLYGRVIEGVTVDRQQLKGRIRERAVLRSLQRKHASDDAKGGGLEESAAGYQPAPAQAKLANIYGYARGGVRTILPRPVAYLVDDEGEEAAGWDQFPAEDEYRCWEVEPREMTLRFDVRPGSFDELLLRGEPAEDGLPGANEPEGGTLIRGADNRLYLIPLALEPFEVRDQTEVSRLQIEAQHGREIKVDSVRSLTGRSTLVARSTLQVRSTLALRSTLAGAADR